METLHGKETAYLGAVEFDASTDHSPYLGRGLNPSKHAPLQSPNFDADIAERFQASGRHSSGHGNNKPASDSSGSSSDLHNHAKSDTPLSFHVSLNAVGAVRSLDLQKIKAVSYLQNILGERGDFLNPKGGNNTVIGAKGNDLILGRGRGFNTITTGTGKDIVVLGQETTNRIFDFDPAKDRLALAGNLKIQDIVIAQGQNPGKGGVDQPLDSTNSTLVIDKTSGHILAALTFVKAETITEQQFVGIQPEQISKLAARKDFDSVQRASSEGQQLTGTQGRDKLIGDKGDDFLYLGDDSFKLGPVTGSGPGEFPFPNTSLGTSRLNLSLKAGVMRVDGDYQNFEGLPLFSDGVQEVAPDAVIPNNADPKALIAGFLKVPFDDEGNPISGFHLHFSRENFADATVERYFTVTPANATSGKVSAQFELTPELQAALLAKNLYGNLHSTKHPVGENRLEFKTVKFV